MQRRLLHLSLVLGMTCLLVACGFHLRGTGGTRAALPEEWKSMHLVSSNPNGEFSRNVIALFAANGVQWAESDAANFRLVITPETFEQRNLSLNAEARVAEFELTMRSQFSVLDASGREVMPLTDVTVVKQMENDPRNVVGKEGEVRLIQNEMRYELAEQIMRRIGFFATSSTPPAS
jgi:LPS-assembly lipoprotein